MRAPPLRDMRPGRLRPLAPSLPRCWRPTLRCGTHGAHLRVALPPTDFANFWVHITGTTSGATQNARAVPLLEWFSLLVPHAMKPIAARCVATAHGCARCRPCRFIAAPLAPLSLSGPASLCRVPKVSFLDADPGEDSADLGPSLPQPSRPPPPPAPARLHPAPLPPLPPPFTAASAASPAPSSPSAASSLFPGTHRSWRDAHPRARLQGHGRRG